MSPNVTINKSITSDGAIRRKTVKSCTIDSTIAKPNKIQRFVSGDYSSVRARHRNKLLFMFLLNKNIFWMNTESSINMLIFTTDYKQTQRLKRKVIMIRIVVGLPQLSQDKGTDVI